MSKVYVPSHDVYLTMPVRSECGSVGVIDVRYYPTQSVPTQIHVERMCRDTTEWRAVDWPADLEPSTVVKPWNIEKPPKC